jgi:hypothetical protein
MRTYSGTNDFIRLAQMYREILHIAGQQFLVLVNQMDGRGPFI